MKQLLLFALQAAERVASRSPEAAELRNTLLQSVHRRTASPDQLSESDCEDLRLTQDILARMSWIEAPLPLPDRGTRKSSDSLSEARAWRAALMARGVMDGRRFVRSTGYFLDVFDQFGTAEEQGFALQQAERLLRHAEVRRQASFTETIPPSEPSAVFIEKCDVAILFSHLAVRHRDLRYLNTAFKMNDWLLARRRPGTLPTHLMLSIAEQESSAVALL